MSSLSSLSSSDIQAIADALAPASSTTDPTSSTSGGSSTTTDPTSGTSTSTTTAAPGTFQFSAATYSVDEGAGKLDIAIQRVGGSSGVATVDWRTNGVTATFDQDYGSFGWTTLTFADGETSKTESISIVDDSLVEGDETFNVSLANATGGATLGSPTTAVVTIKDNDTTGTSGGTTATPPASLDGASLYANDCAGCHGALASSSKTGATASQIQSAISSVGAMSSLSNLSSAEIQAIAGALASTSTTSSTGSTSGTTTSTSSGSTTQHARCFLRLRQDRGV